VRALRPGGWLVVEDYDISTMAVCDPARPAWSAVNHAYIDMLRARGCDPVFGRRLLALLRSVGLVDVSAEGNLRPQLVPDLAPVFRPVLERLGEPLLASGAVTVQELAEAIGEFDATDGDQPVSAYSPIPVSARGRRPSAPSVVRRGGR
jgi:hypothetical protein